MIGREARTDMHALADRCYESFAGELNRQQTLAMLTGKNRNSSSQISLSTSATGSPAGSATEQLPLIRVGSGGVASADALLCAEVGAGGSRSSSANASGADDIELDSVGPIE